MSTPQNWSSYSCCNLHRLLEGQNKCSVYIWFKLKTPSNLIEITLNGVLYWHYGLLSILKTIRQGLTSNVDFVSWECLLTAPLINKLIRGHECWYNVYISEICLVLLVSNTTSVHGHWFITFVLFNY